MRADFSVPVRPLWAFCLAVWSAGPLVSAQTPPSLGLQLSAGQPTLTITGTTGTVYSIQYATDLSAASPWTDRTLFQVRGTNDVWTDSDSPTPSRRVYRAASVPAPADTNLVFIQSGTFTMGSPTNEAQRFSNETQHTVTISRGFWMEKFLVTQGDYLALMATNPSYFRNGIDGTNAGYSGSGGTITNELTHPVEQVNWYDATNYCALRTQLERAGRLIPTNYVYRLPTESEWEYTARAGTTTAVYLGCDLHSGQANFDGKHEYDCSVGTTTNASGIILGITTPVGSYAANPWGLYDMIGNVEEWCQDWYGEYPVWSVIDPQGPASGLIRVVRGDGWSGQAWGGRSALRYFDNPLDRCKDIGFRVVLAPGQ